VIIYQSLHQSKNSSGLNPLINGLAINPLALEINLLFKERKRFYFSNPISILLPFNTC
jgi:hypothetical protein